MFLQLIHCCPILHVRRSFAKLLGEVSLCRISEVEHNLCSSVSSRMRHRFRFSRVMHPLPPPPSSKETAKRTVSNETKLKGTEILARLSRWSRYRSLIYRDALFSYFICYCLFDFRNIRDTSMEISIRKLFEEHLIEYKPY